MQKQNHQGQKSELRLENEILKAKYYPLEKQYHNLPSAPKIENLYLQSIKVLMGWFKNQLPSAVCNHPALQMML